MSGRDALRDEHESLQRATLDARRHVRAGDVTPFVHRMWAVMDDYHAARKDGMSRLDALKGIEAELRSVWPHRPSKFGLTCDACEDAGWREMTCWSDQRCGRAVCADGHPGYEHLYVVPCSCDKGEIRAGRGRQSQLDEIGEAMRARQPRRKAFSRFGGGA